jgi:FkbM family methyltransferase
MKSYAQHGEDIIIQDFFPHDYKGVCIDVGAVDGILMSNTFHFEQNGWFSICCEANPDMYESLKMNRLEAVHGAIGSKDLLEVQFNIVNLTAQGGNETAISAVTIDERLLRDHDFLQPHIRQVNVPMYTLDTVLLKYPNLTHIDFLSIDTEGTELEVLKGFDIARWSPKLFVIENNYNDPEIEEYLKPFGYTKANRLAVNDFYIKHEA